VQLVDDRPAEAPVPAHDDVVRELIDALLHAAPPEGVAELALQKKAGQGGEEIERRTDAADHQRDGERPTGRGVWNDVPVADGGEGGNRQVERVERPKPLQGYEARRAAGGDERENAQREP